MKKSSLVVVLSAFISIWSLIRCDSFADAGAPMGGVFEGYVNNENGVGNIPYGAKVKVSSFYYFDDEGVGLVEYTDENGNVIYADCPLTDILPAEYVLTEKDLNSMNPTQYFTFLETEVYSGPAFIYDKAGSIPKGTDIEIKYYSGDYFGYVEYNDIKGWVICNRTGLNGVTPTIMKPSDEYFHIFENPLPLLDSDKNETGLFLEPGEVAYLKGTIQVAVNKLLCKIDVSGKEYFIYLNNGVVTENPEMSLYVTNSSKMTVYKDFYLKEKVNPDIAEGTELKVFSLYRDDAYSDSGYCLVVYNGEEYIIHALDCNFNPYALGVLINEDPGVLEISSYSVESSICIEDSDIEVFNDWELKDESKIGVIPVGTTVDVVRVGWDEYCYYAKGYGWMKNYSEGAAFAEYYEANPLPSVTSQDEPKEEIIEPEIEEDVTVKKPDNSEISNKEIESVPATLTTKMKKTSIFIGSFVFVVAIAAIIGIVLLTRKKKEK